MTISIDVIKYPKKFADLCNQIVLAENPEAKAIEGRGGDLGIDSFIGKISGELVIFQYKYFIDKIGPSQKRQIKESLDKAAKLKPKRWTLLVALDFNTSTQQWFEKLSNNYPQINIDYWSRAKLTSLILKHKQIKDEFFPDTELRVKRIEKLLIDKGQLPKTPNIKLLEQIKEIRKLINLDNPHYRYEIHTDKDKVFVTAHFKPEDSGIPLPTFSMKLSFPNDKTGKKAHNAFMDMVKRGKSATIDSQYIEEITSDTGHVLPFSEDISPSKIEINPSSSDIPLPIKLTAIAPDNSTACIDYILMKRIRAGTEEAEISNKGQNIPMTLNLIINYLKCKAKGNFKIRYTGFRPDLILKYEKFFEVASKGEEIEITHLESGNSLGTIELSHSQFTEARDNWVELLKTLVLIEKETDTQLLIPDRITLDDNIVIHHLKSVIKTGRATRFISNYKLTVAPKEAKRILEDFQQNEYCACTVTSESSAIQLFGVTIPLGKCTVSIPQGKLIQSLEELADTIHEASANDNIVIVIDSKDHKATFQYDNWPKKK